MALRLPASPLLWGLLAVRRRDRLLPQRWFALSLAARARGLRPEPQRSAWPALRQERVRLPVRVPLPELVQLAVQEPAIHRCR